MRVVVADDSTLLREGVVRLLEEAGLEVVGQAGDAEELMRKVRAHKPDIAVVDVRMPPTHTDEGLRAARAIRAELPEVSVLVLSQYVEVTYARDVAGEGLAGQCGADLLVADLHDLLVAGVGGDDGGPVRELLPDVVREPPAGVVEQ